MMKMCLSMETADGESRSFPLDQARLVLGRDTRCDLRIAVPSVSMRHCEIVKDGNTLHLKDLGSDGGTFHNGIRVLKAELAPQDRVTIGPVTFVVRPESATDSPGSVAELKPPAPRVNLRPAGAPSARLSKDNS
ncbi:MAG: FHA domain-containing protein [Planctomycetota bacterium]|jgi:pSer/pThr/pTyr-binding forkhead associated (FHA) protein